MHQGYSVLVTGVEGWIGTGLEGFYVHQTRFLSRLHVLVDDTPPKAISANEVDHHFITAYYHSPSPAGRAGEPADEPAEPSGSEVIQKGLNCRSTLSVAAACIWT